MTNQSRYSYTTSWAVGRRIRSRRRIAPMSRRCAGANVSISVRTWASADRRATADWVLPGTSTSTWTARRPEGSFFTLMRAPWDWISAAEDAPRPPGETHFEVAIFAYHGTIWSAALFRRFCFCVSLAHRTLE